MQERFNLENRDSLLNSNTNNIDASSELGVDGNILLDIFSLNQFESIAALSVSLIDLQQTAAYSCKAEGTSRLAIKSKDGISDSIATPLRTENTYIKEDTNNSRDSVKNSRNISHNFSVISVETDDDKIGLAMEIIVRKNGAVSLVGKASC